jgi:hypothetical protein
MYALSGGTCPSAEDGEGLVAEMQWKELVG